MNRIKRFIKGLTRSVDRILIVPDKCFTWDEYELWCRGGLTKETTDKIVENFNEMVSEVISLSARGNKIFVECIGTANEHFVVELKMRRK